MKKVCALLLLTVLQAAVLLAEPEATKDKITRDEAQHIALKQMPDGSVKSARLKQSGGRGVWAVRIAKQGSNSFTEVHVDAKTGHIVPAGETASPAEGPSQQKPKQ